MYKVLYWTSFIVFWVLFVIIMILQFQNPDMTSTRFMMTYPALYIALFVFIGLFWLFYYLDIRKRSR